MKLENIKIPNYQATAFIVMVILPTALLFVPTITIRWAKQDAWVSVLVALDIGLITAWISSKLALRFPNETIISYLPKLIGTIPGKLIGLLYVYNFYFIAYATQVQFATLMRAALIPETPTYVTIAMITFVAGYALYVGLEGLSRANTFIFGVTFVYSLILLSIGILSFDYKDILPVFDTEVNRLFLGAMTPASWLSECAIILMLVPFIKEKNNLFKITSNAVIIVFIFMIVMVLIASSLFGSNLVKNLLFPAFTSAEIIVFEAINVLDILDVVLMSIWVFAMAFKLATTFFAGSLGAAQLLGISSYKIIIIPGGILMTIFALNSWSSIGEIAHYSSRVFPLYLLSVQLVVPTLLLLIAKLRNLPQGNEVQ